LALNPEEQDLGVLVDSIRGIIYNEWSGGQISSEYSELLSLAVSKERQDNAISERKFEMALLPGLCCQAVGGEARWADRVAAAWILFYAAADIMDSVQDRDEPPAWWAELGPAAALSAATGLFFSAASVLHKIIDQDISRKTASEIIQDFFNCFLTMSSGQYQDLRIQEPNLEQYWEIASTKSGSFFSLACRSGARLGTENETRIDHYSQFGKRLGLLTQILDDLEDIQFLTGSTAPVEAEKLTRSLPVVYAMEMYPPETKERLDACLQNAIHDAQARVEAAQLIEESGAVFFLLSEIERNRKIASDHLTHAGARSPARETLSKYLDSLGFTK
jgi:geranylgeranyl pyrophosphate synthase